MEQMSLASTGFELVTKRTRKREFLDEMNLVIPWSELLALIAPHAPAGKTGRPPFPTEVMLRIHLLQQFFGHSDPAMEELLQQVNAQHHFGGKRRAPRLACRRMRRYQGQQLGPWNHQIHLIEELTLARAFGDQLESGARKAHLLHD